MAKGGGSRGGGYLSGRSSVTSSYRVAPAPTPKVNNNIFSTPKKVETPPKKVESTPISSSTSYSKSSYTPSSTPSSGGFLSNMADGFSFGVGTSVARNIVDRIFSNGTSTSIPSTSSTNIPYLEKNNYQCKELEKSWSECMNLHNQDNNICRKAFEDYEACKRNI